MFPTYLLFPPHQPRDRLTLEFVELLRKEHNELLESLEMPRRASRR